MLLRNPNLVAFLLAAIGFALAAVYGEQLWRLPQWSEAEIEQSVELNLELENQRRGPHLRPDGARLEQLRAALRAEVEAEIQRDRQKLERWIGLGLVMMVLGLGQWLRSRIDPPRP